MNNDGLIGNALVYTLSIKHVVVERETGKEIKVDRKEVQRRRGRRREGEREQSEEDEVLILISFQNELYFEI